MAERTIRVDPEFRDLIRPLSEEEFGGLRESVIRDGCRDPLVVWGEEGLLLDGHHRWEICAETGIGFRVKRISLPNRRAARIWIRKHQLSRRNMSKSERAALAAENAEEYEAEARERKAHGKTAPGKTLPQKVGEASGGDSLDSESKTDPHAGEADAQAGKDFGVSREYVRQARKVKAEDESLHDRVRKGEISLPEAGRLSALAKKIDAFPEDERGRAGAFLHGVADEGSHTKTVLDLADNLLGMPAEDRLRIYTLAESESERDRSLAKTEAAKLPPMPNPAISHLRDAGRGLAKAARHVNGTVADRIDSTRREVGALIEAVKGLGS